MLERHLDDYTYAHEERHGTLRKVVPQSVTRYLACGRFFGGFARIRCPTCRDEHLLAFSCRTRNLCPSCQAKRSVLFAERLREEIVSPVSHRHVVFTIPKVLRGLFERERALLGLLARVAYETLRRVLRATAGEGRVVPGVVASIQPFRSHEAVPTPTSTRTSTRSSPGCSRARGCSAPSRGRRPGCSRKPSAPCCSRHFSAPSA